MVTHGRTSLIVSNTPPVLIASSTHSLVSIDSYTIPVPVFSLSGHSLPVTDVYIGASGPSTRVLTASLDRTCKVGVRAEG